MPQRSLLQHVTCTLQLMYSNQASPNSHNAQMFALQVACLGTAAPHEGCSAARRSGRVRAAAAGCCAAPVALGAAQQVAAAPCVWHRCGAVAGGGAWCALQFPGGCEREQMHVEPSVALSAASWSLNAIKLAAVEASVSRRGSTVLSDMSCMPLRIPRRWASACTSAASSCSRPAGAHGSCTCCRHRRTGGRPCCGMRLWPSGGGATHAGRVVQACKRNLHLQSATGILRTSPHKLHAMTMPAFPCHATCACRERQLLSTGLQAFQLELADAREQRRVACVAAQGFAGWRRLAASSGAHRPSPPNVVAGRHPIILQHLSC